MIENALNSINVAEKKAEGILNDAQSSTDEIIKKAHKNGEEKIALLQKQLRSEHETSEEEALSGSVETKNAVKALTEQKLNAIRESAEKNMDQAVEFALERILTI